MIILSVAFGPYVVLRRQETRDHHRKTKPYPLLSDSLQRALEKDAKCLLR